MGEQIDTLTNASKGCISRTQQKYNDIDHGAITTQAVLIVKVNGYYRKLIPGETHYKLHEAESIEIKSCRKTGKTGNDKLWFPKGQQFMIKFPFDIADDASRETHRDKFVKLLTAVGIKELKV